MSAGVFSFTYTMSSIGIGHKGKHLVMTDQFIDQGFSALVVTVVISSAVHQQKISFQRDG